MSIKRPAILVDEMLDGTDEKLRNAGFEAYSAKKIHANEGNMHSDYSILKRAEKDSMILITEDDDNVEGCNENGISVIQYGQNDNFESLISGLRKYFQS